MSTTAPGGSSQSARSPLQTLEISYFNVESTASTPSKKAVAQCEFRMKISGPSKMYASGRCRKTYPEWHKRRSFPVEKKSRAFLLTLPSHSGVLRRIRSALPITLRGTGPAYSSLPRRGTLRYQGRPAGECCVDKFSLAAMSPAIVRVCSLAANEPCVV
jgi:hypothetical protein